MGAKTFESEMTSFFDEKLCYGERKINVFKNSFFVADFKEKLMIIIDHIKTLAWKSKDFDIISFSFLLIFFWSVEIVNICCCP